LRTESDRFDEDMASMHSDVASLIDSVQRLLSETVQLTERMDNYMAEHEPVRICKRRFGSKISRAKMQ
jgi:hypothetical protein